MNAFRMALEDCELNDLGYIDSYFHKVAVQRQLHGRTNEFKVMNGTNFFEELFSALEMGLDERVFWLVEKQITDDMNDFLLQQFIEEEIAYAVKMMVPLKAPGSDGFLAIFFQRSISLCNVVYKIIAKVLVNRISTILGSCINEAQGAFIPGKHILDNVLIAYKRSRAKGTNERGSIGRERFFINHLFFVDDCILFGDASNERAKVVGDVIKEYETISSQRVNFEKSLIYFGANVNVNIKNTITNALGVRVA
ncbi:hypothetical protein J1N35_006023 [Gossypium stocksii]|uniref:Reverse transcriptase domain-containing protein n=1 Tax=Gossypium stocksii TaxID=47602 RepID=A0A9D3WFJ1_9ROSI|nr:hypothetical protein J1N35_006023 [Gossypium stocksii]